MDTFDELATMLNGHVARVIFANHRKNLTERGKKTLHQQLYCAGTRHRKLELTEIKRKLAEEVTDPDRSIWAPPLVFASKKDVSLSFCVKLKNANAITVSYSRTIPRIEKCIDFLQNAKVVSALNVNSVN